MEPTPKAADAQRQRFPSQKPAGPRLSRRGRRRLPQRRQCFGERAFRLRRITVGKVAAKREPYDSCCYFAQAVMGSICCARVGCAGDAACVPFAARMAGQLEELQARG